MVWLLGVAAKGRLPPPVGSLPVVLGDIIDLVHKLFPPAGPSAVSGGSSFELGFYKISKQLTNVKLWKAQFLKSQHQPLNNVER